MENLTAYLKRVTSTCIQTINNTNNTSSASDIFFSTYVLSFLPNCPIGGREAVSTVNLRYTNNIILQSFPRNISSSSSTSTTGGGGFLDNDTKTTIIIPPLINSVVLGASALPFDDHTGSSAATSSSDSIIEEWLHLLNSIVLSRTIEVHLAVSSSSSSSNSSVDNNSNNSSPFPNLGSWYDACRQQLELIERALEKIKSLLQKALKVQKPGVANGIIAMCAAVLIRAIHVEHVASELQRSDNNLSQNLKNLQVAQRHARDMIATCGMTRSIDQLAIHCPFFVVIAAAAGSKAHVQGDLLKSTFKQRREEIFSMNFPDIKAIEMMTNHNSNNNNNFSMFGGNQNFSSGPSPGLSPVRGSNNNNNTNKNTSSTNPSPSLGASSHITPTAGATSALGSMLLPPLTGSNNIIGSSSASSSSLLLPESSSNIVAAEQQQQQQHHHHQQQHQEVPEHSLSDWTNFMVGNNNTDTTSSMMMGDVPDGILHSTQNQNQNSNENTNFDFLFPLEQNNNNNDDDNDGEQQQQEEEELQERENSSSFPVNTFVRIFIAGRLATSQISNPTAGNAEKCWNNSVSGYSMLKSQYSVPFAETGTVARLKMGYVPVDDEIVDDDENTDNSTENPFGNLQTTTTTTRRRQRTNDNDNAENTNTATPTTDAEQQEEQEQQQETKTKTSILTSLGATILEDISLALRCGHPAAFHAAVIDASKELASRGLLSAVMTLRTHAIMMLIKKYLQSNKHSLESKQIVMEEFFVKYRDQLPESLLDTEMQLIAPLILGDRFKARLENETLVFGKSPFVFDT